VPDQDRQTADSEQADSERADSEPERRRAEIERLPAEQPGRGQAQQRPRAGQRRGNPDQAWPGDAGEEPDALWPPFLGPGGIARRGSGAHRMLHERAEREQRGRGRSRLAVALSRAQIVDAAIAVADAGGSDAVTMRRIAQVLGAGTMSLYWHVANKEQLLDLMLDALIGELDALDAHGEWRADLRAQARSQRATLLRHPWVMDFVGGRPPLGPNTLLHLDRSLAVLDGLGLDVRAAVNILGTVQAYVMGSVLRELQAARLQRDGNRADITAEEWELVRSTWRNRLHADGRFTRVVRFLDAGFDPDAEETRDERFESGLDCIIDGIAAKIALPGLGFGRQPAH
jgi:AcrR family transcriptional regulator